MPPTFCPAIYDDPSRSWWLTETPLAVLRAGREAVDFFFVLSGFVLVLPFLKGPVAYPDFVFRRVCRIWIPLHSLPWLWPSPVPSGFIPLRSRA